MSESLSSLRDESYLYGVDDDKKDIRCVRVRFVDDLGNRFSHGE